MKWAIALFVIKGDRTFFEPLPKHRWDARATVDADGRRIEPDSCFYIQNESVVRGKSINLPTDPPPDLVIESDYTNSSLNKFSIYAALGVPEIWRYRNQSLQVYQLVEGSYEKRENSLAFPFLPIAEIPDLIEQSKTIGQRAAVRLFQERIREVLAQ